MPMLTVAKTSWPAMVRGSRRTDWIRSATAIASSRSSMSSSRIVNSSPPRRATVSPGRTAVLRAELSSTRRRSPTLWPRLSLTSLKRSTSRNTTANMPLWWPRAMAPCRRASAACRRSMKRARLGRPVRASWKASCWSCSSARRRSVTSAPMEAVPETSPVQSRSTVLLQATTRRSPWRVTMAVSSWAATAPSCMRSRRVARPDLAVLLRHEGGEPLAPDHVLLLVADQLQEEGVAVGDARPRGRGARPRAGRSRGCRACAARTRAWPPRPGGAR